MVWYDVDSLEKLEGILQRIHISVYQKKKDREVDQLFRKLDRACIEKGIPAKTEKHGFPLGLYILFYRFGAYFGEILRTELGDLFWQEGEDVAVLWDKKANGPARPVSKVYKNITNGEEDRISTLLWYLQSLRSGELDDSVVIIHDKKSNEKE